jgi:hypothetical protein
MATRFKTHNIAIYEEVRDAEFCGVDSYGKPRKCLVGKSMVKGGFHPMSQGKQLREFGQVIKGSAKLFLDPDVEITSTCKVRVEGEEPLFQVQGIPAKRTARLSHIKVLLVPEGFDPDD